MRLKCAVCKKNPSPYNRYVKLESFAYAKEGILSGVSLMVCPEHLPKEIGNALRIWDEGIFCQDQVAVEKQVFGKEF